MLSLLQLSARKLRAPNLILVERTIVKRLFSCDPHGNCGCAPKSSSKGSGCDGPECWACGNCVNQAQIVCGKCSYVQPLEKGTNYFEVLNLKPTFDLNMDELDASYKRLQRVVHPDLFTSRSEKEQEISADVSSVVNIAHKILKNPVSRAQYILQLNGIDAIGETVDTQNVSPELLMQVMEAHEIVNDPTSSKEDLITLRDSNNLAIDNCIKDLRSAFSVNDLNLAKEITVALQYYSRLSSEITERLEKDN